MSQVFLQLIAALYKKKASIDYSAQQDCITISVYFLFYFIVKELISTDMIKVFRGWYTQQAVCVNFRHPASFWQEKAHHKMEVSIYR